MDRIHVQTKVTGLEKDKQFSKKDFSKSQRSGSKYFTFTRYFTFYSF